MDRLYRNPTMNLGALGAIAGYLGEETKDGGPAQSVSFKLQTALGKTQGRAAGAPKMVTLGFVFAGILMSGAMWGERRDVGLVARKRAFSMSTLQSWGAVDYARNFNPATDPDQPPGFRSLRQGLRQLRWDKDPALVRKLSPLDIGTILVVCMVAFLCEERDQRHGGFKSPGFEDFWDDAFMAFCASAASYFFPCDCDARRLLGPPDNHLTVV